MNRRDVARLELVVRYSVRNYLTDELRISKPIADQWCDAWEQEAKRRQQEPSEEFWRLGLAWIMEERAARRRPFE